MTRGMLTWPLVAQRLGSDRSYWLSTMNRAGGPQVSPVWGVVVADVWYFYSERTTAKARNLAADTRVALHLNDAEDVLIVHGIVEDLGHPGDWSDVMDAFGAKYTRPSDLPFLPRSDAAFDVLYALRPLPSTGLETG